MCHQVHYISYVIYFLMITLNKHADYAVYLIEKRECCVLPRRFMLGYEHTR